MKNFWKSIFTDKMLITELSYVIHLHIIKNNILITDTVTFFTTLHTAPEFVLPICLESYFPYYLRFYPFGIVNKWCYIQINKNTSLLPEFERAVHSNAFAMNEVVHGTSHYSCMLDTSGFNDLKNILFILTMRWFVLFFGSAQPIQLLLKLTHYRYLEDKHDQIVGKYSGGAKISALN